MTATSLRVVRDPHASDDLAELERIIADGLKTFVDVGQALARIRDGELYRREDYSTFTEYCRARWDFGRSRAHQLIAASAVVSNVHNCGHALPAPENEAQARELAKLPPEEQVEAWREALGRVPDDGTVTAKTVAEVVRHRRQTPGEKVAELAGASVRLAEKAITLEKSDPEVFDAVAAGIAQLEPELVATVPPLGIEDEKAFETACDQAKADIVAALRPAWATYPIDVLAEVLGEVDGELHFRLRLLAAEKKNQERERKRAERAENKKSKRGQRRGAK